MKKTILLIGICFSSVIYAASSDDEVNCSIIKNGEPVFTGSCPNTSGGNVSGSWSTTTYPEKYGEVSINKGNSKSSKLKIVVNGEAGVEVKANGASCYRAKSDKTTLYC